MQDVQIHQDNNKEMEDEGDNGDQNDQAFAFFSDFFRQQPGIEKLKWSFVFCHLASLKMIVFATKISFVTL